MEEREKEKRKVSRSKEIEKAHHIEKKGSGVICNDLQELVEEAKQNVAKHHADLAWDPGKLTNQWTRTLV